MRPVSDKANLFVLLMTLATGLGGEPFGLQLNPTGDPIGGGPGYRDIKSPDEADFVVGTRDELVKAIAGAKAGQTIYVRDSAAIDMTGADDQSIPGGVVLASGRGRAGSSGGLIFLNTLSEERKFMPLFRTGGKEVRITGLRLQGPFAEIGDHDYKLVKIANGIKADHEGLEVDNCELWGWNKWAIDLAVAGRAHVHHSYIHHTRRWGYGYGVWVRGGGKAIIEANLFDFCRHHIGSGAQATSSYEARYNICLYHDVQPSFDRHGDPRHAGFETFIHHNEFRNSAYPAILLRGNPVGEARFHHNWFAHANRQLAINDRRATQREKVHVHDNVYGGVSKKFHPEARVRATPPEGPAPLTVKFDGTASRDREGGRIIRYRWNIPDGPGATGIEAHTPVTAYTFSQPGRYPVALFASNEFGVPGVTRFPVTVYPARGGYVLSAWVKDSYVGPLRGYLRKLVLLDGKVVWEDDLEGDEGGWQHVILDVSKLVAGRKEVELSFRLRADRPVSHPKEQIIESYFYVDDVYLFGGEVKYGDFEYRPGEPAHRAFEKAWTYHAEPPAKEGGFRIHVPTIWTGEARSGQWGLVLGAGYNEPIAAGAICEVKQKVRLGPIPKPARAR